MSEGIIHLGGNGKLSADPYCRWPCPECAEEPLFPYTLTQWFTWLEGHSQAHRADDFWHKFDHDGFEPPWGWDNDAE